MLVILWARAARSKPRSEYLDYSLKDTVFFLQLYTIEGRYILICSLLVRGLEISLSIQLFLEILTFLADTSRELYATGELID